LNRWALLQESAFRHLFVHFACTPCDIFSGASLVARNKLGGRSDAALFGVEEFADDAPVENLRNYADNVTEFLVIPWKDIHINRKIGEGAFGEVMIAEWSGVDVAVKLFKNTTAAAMKDFEHEALRIAKVSHHPHAVRFIGASFKEGSIAMVLALCSRPSVPNWTPAKQAHLICSLLDRDGAKRPPMALVHRLLSGDSEEDLESTSEQGGADPECGGEYIAESDGT
jgi:hypothetical protein